MRKLITYISYLFEYIKFGDLTSVFNAIYYVVNNKSLPSDRVIRTSTGVFFTRGGTNDFQFANHNYEKNIKDFILSSFKDGFTHFFDIGTCIGEHSIYASHTGLKAYAFEAIPQNARVFRLNMDLNNTYEDITFYNHALGSCNEVGQFFYEPVNTGASRRVYGEKAISVSIRPFDDIFDELYFPYSTKSLFKIDVEGMELEVLSGAKQTLRMIDDVRLIIEDKFDDQKSIEGFLKSIGNFDFERLDEYNVIATKRK